MKIFNKDLSEFSKPPEGFNISKHKKKVQADHIKFNKNFFKDGPTGEQCLEAGYTEEQLKRLVEEGKLYRGGIMYAGGKCDRIYATTKEEAEKFHGHVRI